MDAIVDSIIAQMLQDRRSRSSRSARSKSNLASLLAGRNSTMAAAPAHELGSEHKTEGPCTSTQSGQSRQSKGWLRRTATTPIPANMAASTGRNTARAAAPACECKLQSARVTEGRRSRGLRRTLTMMASAKRKRGKRSDASLRVAIGAHDGGASQHEVATTQLYL
eukprot:1719049-Prymnesium_polylepis.1